MEQQSSLDKAKTIVQNEIKEFNNSKDKNFVSIDIPSNSGTLQSGISNRHSRTKGSTINGNVYNKQNRRKKLQKNKRRGRKNPFL